MKKLGLLTLLTSILLFSAETPLQNEAEFIGIMNPQEYLFEVRDFSVIDGRVATVTNYEPVVDIFQGGNHTYFGRKGQGPGEFQNPTNIGLSETGKVGVMDFPAPYSIKFVQFDGAGHLEKEEMLREIGTISSFTFINGEEIVALTGEFSSNRYSLIHYDGNNYHEVYNYESEQIVITPDIGPVPRFTVTKPFTNNFVWTRYSNNEIAIWNGDDKIEIVNLDGEVLKTYEFDLQRIELSNHMISDWIDQNYPVEASAFGHENFYAGVRKFLHEETIYPDQLPVVLGLQKNLTEEGIWIKRKPASEGELWNLLTDQGIIKSITFPKKRSVIGFSGNYAYAVSTDVDGFDNIEKYKP